MTESAVVVVSQQERVKTEWFLVTLSMCVEGGLAFNGYEWHQKCLVTTTDNVPNHKAVLEAFIQREGFSAGELVKTHRGWMILLKSPFNAEVFVVSQRISAKLGKQLHKERLVAYWPLTVKTFQERTA